MAIVKLPPTEGKSNFFKQVITHSKKKFVADKYWVHFPFLDFTALAIMSQDQGL